MVLRREELCNEAFLLNQIINKCLIVLIFDPILSNPTFTEQGLPHSHTIHTKMDIPGLIQLCPNGTNSYLVSPSKYLREHDYVD